MLPKSYHYEIFPLANQIQSLITNAFSVVPNIHLIQTFHLYKFSTKSPLCRKSMHSQNLSIVRQNYHQVISENKAVWQVLKAAFIHAFTWNNLIHKYIHTHTHTQFFIVFAKKHAEKKKTQNLWSSRKAANKTRSNHAQGLRTFKNLKQPFYISYRACINLTCNLQEEIV